jgi:hypothetical protein
MRVNDGTGVLVGIMWLAFALLVAGWQVIGYLKTGNWIGVGVIEVVRFFDGEWVEKPTSWIGLNEVLRVIPLSITFLAMGLANLFLTRD